MRVGPAHQGEVVFSEEVCLRVESRWRPIDEAGLFASELAPIEEAHLVGIALPYAVQPHRIAIALRGGPIEGGRDRAFLSCYLKG